MDGRDLQRRAGRANRAARAGIEALRRRQAPLRAGSGEECARLARDPERRFEPLRRAQSSEARPA